MERSAWTPWTGAGDKAREGDTRPAGDTARKGDTAREMWGVSVDNVVGAEVPSAGSIVSVDNLAGAETPSAGSFVDLAEKCRKGSLAIELSRKRAAIRSTSSRSSS